MKINKIFALGDSLTNGYGLKEKETWRYLIAKEFNCEVYNAGINGSTSSEGLTQLKELSSELIDSNLCIINFGVNDMIIGMDQFGSVNTEKYKNNILNIIDLVKKTNTKIILVSVHRMIYDYNKPNTYFFARHNVEQYQEENPNQILNKAYKVIKDIASEYNITLIDMFNDKKMINKEKMLLSLENSNEDDGVHYSKEGSSYLAKKLTKIIKEEREI